MTRPEVRFLVVSHVVKDVFASEFYDLLTWSSHFTDTDDIHLDHGASERTGDESTLAKDYSVPLMHHDPSLGGGGALPYGTDGDARRKF